MDSWVQIIGETLRIERMDPQSPFQLKEELAAKESIV